ncbi:MAG: formylglycine-generating enzyme family protein [Deltaproteobacteria bacterium]|nr:formylglycine-generating enzyme family protein [Deltaproteobacteria bacterium]
MSRGRRVVVVVAATLVVAGVAGWLTRAQWLPRLIAMRGTYMDIGGIVSCDAEAVQEGRPIQEGPGCMVPMPPLGLEERWGPGGEGLPVDTFIMGAQASDPEAPMYDPDADTDEAPPHRVRLSPFWMHRHEVSVGQFRWCVLAGACDADDIEQSGGYFNYGREDRRWHPANGVSWFGARDYCAWIGGRLPTEAEWEYAARGGKMERRYPWDPDVEPTCRHAVFGGGTQSRCGIESSSEVTYYPGMGENRVSWVEHMAGNVWEWTADWYAEDAYAHSAEVDPRGPPTGTGRVQRGGGWSEADPIALRTTFRAQMDPHMKLADVGFRCVVPGASLAR